MTEGDTPMRSMMLNKAGTHTEAGVPARALNIALWILQGLLAVVFLLHGWLMVAPPAEMVAMINAQLGAGFRMFIGVAELLAVVGLILPGVTRILPLLTAVAAAGLMFVMGSATTFHLFRGEDESAITTAVLFVLVTIVAYTRWKVAPIAPRKRA
jgi:putative oxidoreductase